jgi:hypothetical protein
MKPWGILAVAASICLTVGGGTAAAPSQLLLLSPEEAARLRLGDGDYVAPPGVRGTTGPRIVVRAPVVRQTADGAVIETTPATRFFIVFEPNGAPVDMDSLEIKARKGVLSMSLTPRLKPFIEGSALKAESVTVPEGRFLIQIEILDTSGARATERYRLDVRGS